MSTPKNRICSDVARCLCGLGLAAVIAGCSSTQKNAMTGAAATRPAEVSALRTTGLDSLERDRVALGRFIGAWDFEGWYDPPGEARRQSVGIAAGTVEHRYFLLLDIGRIVEQAGLGELSSGSMLLSAEPGSGLMLTTWSEQAPAVHRFRGSVEAEGSSFVFDEVTPRSGDRLRMVLRFETDDRWVAEFYRKSTGSEVIAAAYRFIRAG